jgi:hypothetical protein
MGLFLGRFPVFYSKAENFPTDIHGWRGTCKPIAPNKNGYRGVSSTERDVMFVALFLMGVHH